MNSESSECLFCRIADGRVPAPKVYEDGGYFAINDIRPQAKTHLLVIPKAHFASLTEMYIEQASSTGLSSASGEGLLEAATRCAKAAGLAPEGYRLVINSGRNAGQTVFHVHVHVLGGEPLSGGFA